MRSLRLTASFVTLTMTLFWFGASIATTGGACPRGTEPAPGSGFICIPVTDPGGNFGSVGDHSGFGGSTGPTECKWNGKVIPCTYPGGGKWSPTNRCYLVPTAQPPSGSDMWDGHDPNDGRIYACVIPGVPGTPDIVFVPNGAAAPPDPAVLARRALGRMNLTVPRVRMAPAPPAMTYVSLETWLWMPSSQWATLRKSVTAGGTTVTVTAEPRRAAWDMGAGSTTCYDPGRAWLVDQMPDGASTSCRYKYDRVSDFQPDKKFTVSATITFRATWTCSGNCLADEGTLGEVDGLPGMSSVRVGERQSVNVGSKEQ